MKIPILASVYRMLGFLGFIAGGLCVILAIAEPKQMPGGIMIGILALFSGIISLGIAEVVTLIAKIEHNTASNPDSGSGKTLTEISATLKSLLQATRATAALPPVPGSERYFIAVDGSVDGPYKRSDIIELKSKGALSWATLCIQEHGKEWRKVSEIE